MHQGDMRNMNSKMRSFISAMNRFNGVVAFLCTIIISAQSRAEFSSAGHGMRKIAGSVVANGELFIETKPTWINTSTPPKPYIVDTYFKVPHCDNIVFGRLVMTLWGGTANYSCSLNVEVNGTNILSAPPLIFGTTNDTNPVFSASLPSVYGSGYGVWLVGLPIMPDHLYKDGSSNHIRITVETADNFDGRINQVTLIAVYQNQSLNNTFEYFIAEGSGDIYRSPSGAQVDSINITLGETTITNPISARLYAVYTYGDTGQNDRLFLNGVQLDSDDVATWDKTSSGLDYGPSFVSFDVRSAVSANNVVRFSVSATDVPGTRESSLRPQLAVLGISGAPQPPSLEIDLNVVIKWKVSPQTYQLEFKPSVDYPEWMPVTNSPIVIDGMNTIILPRTSPEQFYRLRKIE